MNTNIIKTLTLGLGVSAAAMLSSCDRKENAQLKAKVDSLKVELQASQQTARRQCVGDRLKMPRHRGGIRAKPIHTGSNEWRQYYCG